MKLLILNLFSRFKSFEPQKAMIICGDPRGGTTWLAEILKNIPKTALIWEPLNIAEVSDFKKVGFHYRQYIPENVEWRKAKKAFFKLFSRGIFSEYSIQFLSISDYLNANRLIVKFCRANALLPWLVNNFNFNYAPILLIRHPISVAASQMNHGAWIDSLTGFKLPHGKYIEEYNRNESFLNTLQTQEEVLVAQWCISNLPTLRNKHEGLKWITMYYENLVLNPEAELAKIEKSWGIKLPKKSSKQIHKASQTSVDFNSDPNQQLSKWKSYFNQDQIDKMLKVMAHFQCEFYNSEIMPILDQNKSQK